MAPIPQGRDMSIHSMLSPSPPGDEEEEEEEEEEYDE